MYTSRLYTLITLSLALLATASPQRPHAHVAKKSGSSHPGQKAHSAHKVLAHTSKKKNTHPHLKARAAFDNTVKVFSEDHYCLILPREPHTNIGDSEYPGGMQSYCSASGRDNDLQGSLPDNFWSNVEYKKGHGLTGRKYAQLTGCIRPETVDRLNSNDGGGQYDSSGGEGGRGNPRDSVCAGYNHYVEIIEPSERRACIRCCEEFDDCPVDRDTTGCPNVIDGNYFNCA